MENQDYSRPCRAANSTTVHWRTGDVAKTYIRRAQNRNHDKIQTVNWLSNNWKMLFEGIGGAALVSIIGYLCKRFFWPQPPSGHVAGLTAQGARVSDSPVASGSDITQTIGGTHHHYHSPAGVSQPSPVSTEPAPEPQPERPKPNLKIIGCRKIHIRTELDGTFYQSEDGRAFGEAVVVNVTNDARRDAANIGAIIKATIIYQNAGQDLLRGMGCWLNADSAMVQFRVDDSHSVILGVVINEEFSVPMMRRVTYGLGSVAFPIDRNTLDCERATVTVRLTNADTGDLYCEEQFEVVTNPLSISALQ
jgi:hypothetical protein